MARPRQSLYVVDENDCLPATRRETARRLMSAGQKISSLLLTGLTVAVGLELGGMVLLKILMIAVMVFYVLFVGQKLVLFGASAGTGTPGSGVLPRLDDPKLPIVTLLVPCYDEKQVTLTALRDHIDRLRYPQEKLQVLPLFEAADKATIAAWSRLSVDEKYEPLILPGGKIQTKPRACNMGLVATEGELVAIYDAEDRMDPDQILKAVAAFWRAPSEVACVQARLFFWNGDSSWVTRMLSIEYVIHFEFVLKGLARLGLISPLGGTSNFFRTQALRDIAIPATELVSGGLDPGKMIGAWDAHNVTEDAEIAAALVRRGYKIEMIDSFTLEEAPTTLAAAVRQRKRWIKGYGQSGLVHTRRPWQSLRAMGPLRWFSYSLLMLGTPVSLILNPIYWLMTGTYFLARFTPVGGLVPSVPGFIESLFPPAVFYAGTVVCVVGNFLLFYQKLIACLHRQEYAAVKYMFLVPVWWFFTSVSAWWALAELMWPRLRFNWGSTVHGLEDPDREAARIEHYMREFSQPVVAGADRAGAV